VGEMSIDVLGVLGMTCVWGNLQFTNQQSICQPYGNLISHIVCFPAPFNIGSSALLLKVFCMAIEDL
jgi:hypothetical protein